MSATTSIVEFAFVEVNGVPNITEVFNCFSSRSSGMEERLRCPLI